MLAHRFWEQGFHIFQSVGAEWRVGRVALMVAVVTVLAGRLLGQRALGAAACGFGAAAGWAVLSNLPAWPRTMADRLPELAAVALLVVFLLERPRWRRSRNAVLLALAILSGWWLAGAPHSGPGLLHGWRAIAIVAGWTAATTLLLEDADGWRIAAAALALWAALHAVGAPAAVILLALVPAGAAIGALAAPGGAATMLPAAAGTGAVAGLAIMAAGRLAHGRIGVVDWACLAPFAAIWLAERILPRLRRLGPLAMPAAGILALLGVALAAFTAAALAGLR